MGGSEIERGGSKRRLRELGVPRVDMVPEDFMDIRDLWEGPCVGLVPEDFGWVPEDSTEE